MSKQLDLLSVASWLAIIVIAIQYYVANFVVPEKWRLIDKRSSDPLEAEKLKKEFKRKFDLTVFIFLLVAVLLGIIEILRKLL